MEGYEDVTAKIRETINKDLRNNEETSWRPEKKWPFRVLESLATLSHKIMQTTYYTQQTNFESA